MGKLQMTDQQKALIFDHEKNITVGKARVIYGPYRIGFVATNVWHLPGGAITTDEQEAHAYAVRMNALMGGA